MLNIGQRKFYIRMHNVSKDEIPWQLWQRHIYGKSTEHLAVGHLLRSQDCGNSGDSLNQVNANTVLTIKLGMEPNTTFRSFMFLVALFG